MINCTSQNHPPQDQKSSKPFHNGCWDEFSAITQQWTGIIGQLLVITGEHPLLFTQKCSMHAHFNNTGITNDHPSNLQIFCLLHPEYYNLWCCHPNSPSSTYNICHSRYSVDPQVPVLLPISSTLHPSSWGNDRRKEPNLWDKSNVQHKEGKIDCCYYWNTHSQWHSTHWCCTHGKSSTYAGNGSNFQFHCSASSNLIETPTQGKKTWTTHCSTDNGTQWCPPCPIIMAWKNDNTKISLGKHFL